MAGKVKVAAKKPAAKEKKAADKKPEKKAEPKDGKVKENKARVGKAVKPEKKSVVKKNKATSAFEQMKATAKKAEKKPAPAKPPVPESVPAPATPENQEKQPQEKTGGFFSKLFRALGGGCGEPFPGPKGEKTWTNSIGMEFVYCPAGTFMMGSELKRVFCRPDKMPEGYKKSSYFTALWEQEEKEGKKFYSVPNTAAPVHKVIITKPFYMAKLPTTLAAWQAIMGNNPMGDRQGKPYHPDTLVRSISWFDAQRFIKKLNKAENTTRYRLPTEAEWEYAARAGTTTEFFWGDSADHLASYISAGRTSRFKGFAQKPNPWGLYALYGEISEWVQDWYARYPFNAASQTDPQGPESGENRVLRGGHLVYSDMKDDNGNAHISSAVRFHEEPDHNISNGFRLALTVEA